MADLFPAGLDEPVDEIETISVDGEDVDTNDDQEIEVEGDVEDDGGLEEDDEAVIEEKVIDPEELSEKLLEIENQLGAPNYVQKLEVDTKEQTAFLEKYGDFLGLQPSEKEDNVLHIMASKRPVSPFLIRHILANHKERMDDRDNARRRPLTVAIEVRKELFIKTVLESKYDDADLERILGVVSSDMGNGIHSAIRNGLDPQLIIELIGKVSDDVLKAKDGAGCTPLHRAVEYERCTAAQLDVVKALLQRGDSALDQKNHARQSVYQYHFFKRPREEKTTAKPVLPAKPRSTNISQPQGSSALGDKTVDGRGKKPVYEMEDPKKRGQETLPGQQQPHGNGEFALRRAGTFRQDDGVKDAEPKTPISPANYQANVSRKTTVPGQPPPTRPPIAQTKSSSSTTKTQRGTPKRVVKMMAPRITTVAPPVSKEFADQIAKEVKLAYLRSTFKNGHRNHDTAVEFLYGDRQSKHICFNLLQRDKPLGQKSLARGSYSRFEFDTALQFVAVGPISVHKPGEPVNPERGRRDMVTLFEWLKSKKVKNIIKVIVEDSKDPYHSDEAIVEALRHFSIEILDWSKPDICPETIRAACKDARELLLSWSGLNGMLIAWAGVEGLANMASLTDIHLRQINNLESEDWTTKKLDDFEKRLKNTRDWLNAKRKISAEKTLGKGKVVDMPPITVHRPRVQVKADGLQPLEGGPEQSKETVIKDHQWLEIMDRFASGIYTLPPDEIIKSVPDLPMDLKRDVRICLIDDGVDTEHKGISERMDGGRSFGTYTGDEYRGMAMPFYDSTTGHGTLMANMMVRVCPYAKIESYRLDTRRGDDQRIHFTAKSAADALEYAVKQDFDIISMSWTVKQEMGVDEDNSKDITRLNDALRQAVNKSLVFCSAPDTGDISPEELGSYYPVGSGIKELFRIGAAKADGQAWPQAGGRNIVEYILPGHDVREKKGEEVVQNDKTLKSGSSIATALAAGLAALMIHVVRMAAMHTYELKKDKSNEANIIKLHSLSSIRSHATMRKTFNNMTRSKTYVHVWNHFNQNGIDLRTANEVEDPTAEKWRIIAELARDIVSSKNINDPKSAGA
ncbi:hypothetical protein QBC47DRAFT_297737 [Echria macrotheca]|uniref:Peptidase S8/S53 domain-containing protein n=1 Tax=Echria macrotheca TaxID=438768 RepID=A0AAJ0BG78_9PEZI|nr:hypothetical protein QBC47DRAFT_297737 [Echria macrotheca]